MKDAAAEKFGKGQRSMSSRSSIIGIATPVIRKLIRRGDAYMCSICRSEYETALEANNCLNHCWFDLKNFYPVVLRRGLKGRTLFRCHFCCRDYKEEGEALGCARRCLNERNQQHFREQLLNDMPLDAPPKRPSRLRLAIKRTPPRKEEATPQQAIAAAPEAPASPSVALSQPPVSTPEPSVTEALSPVPAAPARTGRHKDSFEKPWVRHDAKYKCNVCLKKYFTKMEADACFTGHFDEEGYEKETSLEI